MIVVAQSEHTGTSSHEAAGERWVLTDPELGTGLMMCCTFGDQEDVEKWQKYDLPLRVVQAPSSNISQGRNRAIEAAATP